MFLSWPVLYKTGFSPCTFHSINRHSSDLQLKRQRSVNCSRIARELIIYSHRLLDIQIGT
jgi:hypothetical protein